MSEKTIQLEEINPLELYGVNDQKLTLIKTFFPKLKVIARGNQIKVIGEAKEIAHFDERVQLLISYYHKYNRLTEGNIERIMRNESVEAKAEDAKGNDVLVFGPDGLTVRPRTANQRKIVECFGKSDIVFAVGPAGTGKTYTAVALAVQALKNKVVKRIVLTRPAVEAGENLGFLPGDLKEKLDPYLQPLYDGLRDMLPAATLKTYLENGIIEIAPLAFMRGRTLDRAVIILDEAQNASLGQIKMLLTRMGRDAKILVTGDDTQVDLPKSQKSGLLEIAPVLANIKGIEFVRMDEHDVVRHKLVKEIIKAFGKFTK
ncbi:MAG: PhoH family protein [Flavobacteriales bacterium]|nr:PhoH family protein [Flavobacteriales bacterium]